MTPSSTTSFPTSPRIPRTRCRLLLSALPVAATQISSRRLFPPRPGYRLRLTSRSLFSTRTSGIHTTSGSRSRCSDCCQEDSSLTRRMSVRSAGSSLLPRTSIQSSVGIQPFENSLCSESDGTAPAAQTRVTTRCSFDSIRVSHTVCNSRRPTLGRNSSTAPARCSQPLTAARQRLQYRRTWEVSD